MPTMEPQNPKPKVFQASIWLKEDTEPTEEVDELPLSWQLPRTWGIISMTSFFNYFPRSTLESDSLSKTPEKARELLPYIGTVELENLKGPRKASL